MAISEIRACFGHVSPFPHYKDGDILMLIEQTDSRSFNFPSTFACSFIAVFSFLVRFFRFFELVHGHFHGLGLFIPKIITPRKKIAWWLIN